MSSSLKALIDSILLDFFRFNPTMATNAGQHDFDAFWPDISNEGHHAFVEWIKKSSNDLRGVDDVGLTKDERMDKVAMLEQLDQVLFEETELRIETWSPMAAVNTIGDGLFSILSREFAPLPTRLQSALGRIKGIEKFLDGFKQQLLSKERRLEVAKVHAETAAKRMGGITELLGATLEESKKNEAAAKTDAEKAAALAVTQEIVQASADAAIALKAFVSWINTDLLPSAKGDFRLSKELYLGRFKHYLRTDLTPYQLIERARAEYDVIKKEMARIAKLGWPQYLGKDTPLPDNDDVTIRKVLDEVAKDHTGPKEMLDYCVNENSKLEEFVKKNDIISLPTEPLKLIWTPEFLRSAGGAFLMSPGPLDRHLDAFFLITPLDDLPPDQQESALREDNKKMLSLLSIHEAIPGHYLQLNLSNKCPSLPLTVFSSDVFAEGWAVWVTQHMIDMGYGKDDYGLLLNHWKFYLRATTNAIIDISNHMEGMTRDEAIKLMVEGGFQEEAEASAKWVRATLNSAQLCCYYLGMSEMRDMVSEGQRRAQAAGNAFHFKTFLEELLSHGTPSFRTLRQILFQ